MLREDKGKIIDGKVMAQIEPNLEHGSLTAVHALVMHQTGGSDAKGTLAKYKTKGAAGAHFLIDKDGKIYQTAHVNKRTFHVGPIQSRCLSLKSCSPADATAIQTILHPPKTKGAHKVPYSTKVRQLSDHEMTKAYPDRYPSNADSIGIEVVGKTEKGIYEDPTDKQAESVRWLVAGLLELFSLTTDDVYRHPQVSYKDATEAKNVTW
jgi:N-acetyl-anhydromuramyl-L-alanine amidase AmpD